MVALLKLSMLFNVSHAEARAKVVNIRCLLMWLNVEVFWKQEV